ncbi:hypothetical protein F4808DRAFT_55001 [Astrocystis sublimbata]|nr:hypothetical protein F4808DRAFT_55001 [Astrocystis sublimbata]
MPIERNGSTWDSLKYIYPYANPAKTIDPAWKGFSVEHERIPISSYGAVSTSLKVYVVHAVSLTLSEDEGADRLTPMRLREIIIDNYLAAGGDMRTWRFCGVSNIVNTVTRAQAKQLFTQLGLDFNKPSTAQVWHGTKAFPSAILGNPFTRCVLSLIRNHKWTTGQAKIKRIVFISGGLQPVDYVFDVEADKMIPEDDSNDNPKLNLVIELFRPGDIGYPTD